MPMSDWIGKGAAGQGAPMYEDPFLDYGRSASENP